MMRIDVDAMAQAMREAREDQLFARVHGLWGYPVNAPKGYQRKPEDVVAWCLNHGKSVPTEFRTKYTRDPRTCKHQFAGSNTCRYCGGTK